MAKRGLNPDGLPIPRGSYVQVAVADLTPVSGTPSVAVTRIAISVDSLAVRVGVLEVGLSSEPEPLNSSH